MMNGSLKRGKLSGKSGKVFLQGEELFKFINFVTKVLWSPGQGRMGDSRGKKCRSADLGKIRRRNKGDWREVGIMISGGLFLKVNSITRVQWLVIRPFDKDGIGETVVRLVRDRRVRGKRRVEWGSPVLGRKGL